MNDQSEEMRSMHRSIRRLQYAQVIVFCAVLSLAFWNTRTAVVHADGSPDEIRTKRLIIDGQNVQLTLGEYSSSRPISPGSTLDMFGISINALTGGQQQLSLASMGTNYTCLGLLGCYAGSPEFHLMSKDQTSFISMSTVGSSASPYQIAKTASFRMNQLGNYPNNGEVYLTASAPNAAANISSAFMVGNTYHNPQSSLAAGVSQLGLVNCPNKASAGPPCPVNP